MEKGEAISERRNLLDLPLELLESISDLLIPVDYMNFRAVCTTTRQVAPKVQWRTAMSSSDRCRYSSLSSPWLMNFEKNKGVCSFVDPSRGDKYFVSIPKSLQDATLCHCKDGWLLLCRCLPPTTTDPEEQFQHCLNFFNPFTKEIITYPALPRLMFGLRHFGFSSAPSSSNCVVVVVNFLSHFVWVYISRSREEEWSYVQLVSSPVFKPSSSIPIFANGAFYFMGQDGGLGVLRLEEGDNNDSSCSWEILEKTQNHCDSFKHNHRFLAVCDGELLSVVLIPNLGEWVEVFKLNRSIMIWERIENLENRTLYLSRLSSLSVAAKTPDQVAERIYLPRLNGQGIVSFSLSTGMHHYSPGNEEEGSLKHYNGSSLKHYNGTREQLFCGWIEPRWH